MKNNANHPFHHCAVSITPKGSWIVSDAVGAVNEGALTSAVETSLSDLIDSWFD